MVKIGDFTVALVNAETKVPFLEHTAPDGKTYVEVEPDVEYFIRVGSSRDGVTQCRFVVDGTRLDHRSHLRKGGTTDDGLWYFKDGKSTMQALKFTKTPVGLPGSSGDAPAFWTGVVEVKFYEAVLDGYKEQKNHISSWKGGDVGYKMGVSDPNKKKGVQTAQGSISEIKHAERRRRNYKRGAKLETVSLSYCSALGLIYAGVLPKPPAWELHRRTYPRKREESEDEKVPKKIRRGDGEFGTAPTEHDLFDLTEE